jgi:flagellar biosynthesis/type III secretory pathway chaperone
MSHYATAAGNFMEQALLRWELLLNLLEREKSALINNDVDALLQISPEKSMLVAAFLTSHHELQQDKNPENNGLSHHEKLKLQQLQNSAREINHTNGLMIQRLSIRNQSALDTLRGKRMDGFYGPNGQRIHSTLFGSVT